MNLYFFEWQGIAGCYHYIVMAESEELAHNFVDEYIRNSDIPDYKKTLWPTAYNVKIFKAGQVLGVYA